jgi:hypothetical protein
MLFYLDLHREKTICSPDYSQSPETNRKNRNTPAFFSVGSVSQIIREVKRFGEEAPGFPKEGQARGLSLL